jgi:hypothetical protein
MKIRNRKNNIPAAVLLALLTWTVPALLAGGCGQKGPPVPPTGNRPPGVTDLDYSISNGNIKLSWTIPGTNDKARNPVTGFLVYRSKQNTIEADCPNCPIRFTEIGDLPVRNVGRDQEQTSRLVFTQAIEPGFRYVYMVKSYDDDGIAGTESNIVDFKF